MALLRRIVIAILVTATTGAVSASTASQDDAAQVFLTARYTFVTSVRRIPPSVMTELLVRMKYDARLADPGASFNSTDVIDPSYPMRRLILAGIDARSWFVSYEHGGRGYHRHLVVFTERDGRPQLAYAGTFLPDAATVEELRQLVRNGSMQEGGEF